MEEKERQRSSENETELIPILTQILSRLQLPLQLVITCELLYSLSCSYVCCYTTSIKDEEISCRIWNDSFRNDRRDFFLIDGTSSSSLASKKDSQTFFNELFYNFFTAPRITSDYGHDLRSDVECISFQYGVGVCGKIRKPFTEYLFI